MNAKDRGHLTLRLNAIAYDIENLILWVRGKDAEEDPEPDLRLAQEPIRDVEEEARVARDDNLPPFDEEED